MRLAGSGTGAVHRELEKWTEAGLLTVKNIGNQKHYQANRKSPIFKELHQIVLKIIGIADVLRRALEPVADQLELVLVFESVARGIDVLIDISEQLVTDLISAATILQQKLLDHHGRNGGSW